MILRDRYQLAALVARGGMGEVWSARDTVLGRRVAVKVLLPSLAGDPGFAARFLAEARAMAALSHPGIVEIYDYGQADGLAFLVMQFVEGESLVSLIRRTGPVAPEHAMRLVVQAAEAIEAAHGQGIVHRDVKPANLLLRTDGRLALTDFGIARILATDRLTVGEQIVGTFSYLAPEQVTGHEIGPATDVYALGVVAYELLTGTRPFDADTPFRVALKHVHEQPPPLPMSIPEPVRDVVLRAMAKEPSARWQSAAALAQAAASAIGLPSPTTAMPTGATAVAAPAQTALTGPTTRAPAPDGDKPTVPATPTRKRLLVLAGGSLALAIAATLTFVWSPYGGSDPQSFEPDASLSPTAAASFTASASAATSTAPSAPGTRPGTSTAATPAAVIPASPQAQQSTSSATATVPNLYGWREVEVTSEMTRLGLVAHITYRSTLDKCYAIEQSPPGGTVLATGSTVEVVVATATGICKQV